MRNVAHQDAGIVHQHMQGLLGRLEALCQLPDARERRHVAYLNKKSYASGVKIEPLSPKAGDK